MPSQLEILRHQTIFVTDAGAALDSPVVGRIHDGVGTRAGAGRNDAAIAGAIDPGRWSVRVALGQLRGSADPAEIAGAGDWKTRRIAERAGCHPLAVNSDLPDVLERFESDVRECKLAAIA